MGDVKMHEQIMRLRGEFRRETGKEPTSFRLHYEDWYSLMNEMAPHLGYLMPAGISQSGKALFAGMTPLLDAKWPQGFPVCLSPAGAAQAIEAGARAA